MNAGDLELVRGLVLLMVGATALVRFLADMAWAWSATPPLELRTETLALATTRRPAWTGADGMFGRACC